MTPQRDDEAGAFDDARRRQVRMSLEEARSIVAHADRGDLDLEDPEVAHLVAKARQEVQRSLLWGGGRGEPNRRRTVKVMVWTAVAALFMAAMMLIPLLSWAYQPGG